MSLLQAISKWLRLGGHEQRMSAKNVIFITGCDSGLGYTFALFCHQALNMTVVAGCHSSNSQGASNLRQVAKDTDRMHIVEVDLCDAAAVSNARREIEKLLLQKTKDSEALEFTALVNNVGVMCFGEFEWQTAAQCEQQLKVNVLGTWNITRELMPLVRQSHARIINVTSHCALNSLPGVSAYAASKAALRFWNDSLRIELAKYDVKVINFVPGSFVMSSNIAARQQQFADVQLENLNKEQKQFYGDYFARYHNYLGVISGFKQVKPLNDDHLLRKFQHALTHTHPKELYVHEPWRYKIYHLLFSITPTPISDWLRVKFCAMPTYKPVTKEINGKNNKLKEN